MHIATIQGRAERSYLIWIGITIGKLPPHVPQLYRAIQYNIATLLGRVEPSYLTWIGITIEKLPPPPHVPNYIELSNIILPKSRAE